MRKFKILTDCGTHTGGKPLPDFAKRKIWDVLQGVQIGVTSTSDFKFRFGVSADKGEIHMSTDCEKLIEKIRFEFSCAWVLQEVPAEET